MKIELLKKHWFWSQVLKKTDLLNQLPSVINNNIKISLYVFYGVVFHFLTDYLYHIDELLLFKSKLPLWSLFWIKAFPSNISWSFIFVVTSSVINTFCLLRIENKRIRFLNFISFFLLFSALNSNYKINHNLHALLIPLFFFSFIDLKKKECYQNSLVFLTAVFSLLTLYTLSGLWKILRGLVHIVQSEKGIFNLDAMNRLLEYQFLYGQKTSLGLWLMEHTTIGFVALWSGILLEFFSIIIFFYSKFHRIWGISLILLHIAISITMGVSFQYAYISIIPTLVLSPFYERNTFK